MFAKQLKKEGRRNEFERHKLQALNQRQKMVSILKLLDGNLILLNIFVLHTSQYISYKSLENLSYYKFYFLYFHLTCTHVTDVRNAIILHFQQQLLL